MLSGPHSPAQSGRALLLAGRHQKHNNGAHLASQAAEGGGCSAVAATCSAGLDLLVLLVWNLAAGSRPQEHHLSAIDHIGLDLAGAEVGRNVCQAHNILVHVSAHLHRAFALANVSLCCRLGQHLASSPSAVIGVCQKAVIRVAVIKAKALLYLKEGMGTVMLPSAVLAHARLWRLAL